MFINDVIYHYYDERIYFQFSNQIQSEYYGNNRTLYKAGISLDHFQCQANENNENIIGEDIINNVLQFYVWQ